MTIGPRETPYPIILHVDATGSPVRLAESSSIYVSDLSAVTISATNYLGLEGLGGFPGGNIGEIQVKSGNETFQGYPGLSYNSVDGILLAGSVSSNTISSITLKSNTVSATNYLNLPTGSLSSLGDVETTEVSSGQVLLYSSSINKWKPGYTIYKDTSLPEDSLGKIGDIYLRYVPNSTNAAYLSSLLDTDINYVNNGEALIWSSGYWIPSALSLNGQSIDIEQVASNPIWNASSVQGYPALLSNPQLFDILGFGLVGLTPVIQNFPMTVAAPLIGTYLDLSNISDVNADIIPSTNDILTRGNDGYWRAQNTIKVNSISSINISATNYFNIPSSTPIWNASAIQGYRADFTTVTPSLLDILGFGFGGVIQNFPINQAANTILANGNLSSIKDVDDEILPVSNNVLVYTNNFWTPSNSINLNSISATNYLNLPSGTPVWNASAIQGYRADFISTPPQVFDLLGFGSNQIQNFPLALAGPTIAPYINFSSLDGVNAPAPNSLDLLVYFGTDWIPASPITVGELPYWNASRIQGNPISLISASANDVLSYDGVEWKPSSEITVSSIVAVSADLSSVKLSKYVEPKSTVNISSSSITLNLNNSQVFEISAISNISSITIQNTDSRSDIVQGFTIIFSADGTQRTVTDWGPIKWPGGVGPTLTSTNDKKDILSFISPDNGVNWYGFVGGQNF